MIVNRIAFSGRSGSHGLNESRKGCASRWSTLQCFTMSRQSCNTTLSYTYCLRILNIMEHYCSSLGYRHLSLTTLNMADATVLCSTCNAHFVDNATRRQHMSGAWHVHNMKRRIAELPSILLEQYDGLAQDDHAGRDTPNESVAWLPEAEQSDTVAFDQPESNGDDTATSPQCLFCLVASKSLTENLDHMATTHGFWIPHLDQLETDVETLLAYLQLVIGRFHACLYCGHEKQSAEGIRAHMLSKGHCMLDMSPESDFREFWTASKEEDASDSLSPAQRLLSNTEMRTAAGTIITSRHHEQSRLFERARGGSSNEVAIMASSEQTATDDAQQPEQSTSTSTDKSVARRDQMGIVGLSDTQRRNLAVVQKKMVAREQRSRNEARGILEKSGNKTKQKHFKPDVPGRKNG
ncbi:hypothetical protein DOTSEDRAFT_75962 [Dothistroma septosporum NZE10]|uniref:C2H2-type domain-containing protein n=1 Tax=Dothistroma septosporum (strain NZE10 / CBS 128990) TaxID=675120 RepID=M2XG60_DOTSN|nr:hypothetical protein DOTSEDRAFT_75962 [Dothistroma septosporum NZE10]